MRDVEKGNALVKLDVPITPFQVHPDACIYRVPDRLRRVKPDAYTPQMLLIGPLHHSKKAEAAKVANQDFLLPHDNAKSTHQSRYTGYINMEKQKQVYLCEFDKRMGGTGHTIGQLRTSIKEEEAAFRQSYAEPTDWIKSDEFVDMILRDSIFIVELFLRHYDEREDDLLMDAPYLVNTVYEDLILLENQLPYSLMEKLLDPILETLHEMPFRSLVLRYFDESEKVTPDTRFIHFTDLLRCVKVGRLDDEMCNECQKREPITKHLHNAAKLDSVGVNFKPLRGGRMLSDIKFKKGCLKLPIFVVDNAAELILRNTMALEQCHYPRDTYICNYVKLFDFLVENNRDVDLLIEKGIIENKKGGQKATVVEMVNKLGEGLVEQCSVYVGIAHQLEAYYNNPFKRSFGTLRRVYFTNVWKGTATVAATVLLIMTFLQTVASFLQLR